MPQLVDTNVLVDLTRGDRSVANYLDTFGDGWSISMITALELLAGARTQRETNQLDVLMSGCRTISPNDDIARGAYLLIMRYARSHGMQPMDALIAATALEYGLTLVTKNRKHFHMIDGLALEVPRY